MKFAQTRSKCEKNSLENCSIVFLNILVVSKEIWQRTRVYTAFFPSKVVERAGVEDGPEVVCYLGSGGLASGGLGRWPLRFIGELRNAVTRLNAGRAHPDGTSRDVHVESCSPRAWSRPPVIAMKQKIISV